MIQNLNNGTAKFDQAVFEGLLKKLVSTYKYFNNNKVPNEVVVPFVNEVDGVKVTYEQAQIEEITNYKKPVSKKRKRKVRVHASTI